MRFVTFKKKYQPIIMNRSDLRKKSVYNKKQHPVQALFFLDRQFLNTALIKVDNFSSK